MLEQSKVAGGCSRGKLAYHLSCRAWVCCKKGTLHSRQVSSVVAVYVLTARHGKSLTRLKHYSSADSIACSYASGFVFRTDGAQGVGIVNAMRGATVAIVSHLCFCSPLRPLQCLTPLSAVSAATVTAGGIIWVRSANPVKVCKHHLRYQTKLSSVCVFVKSNQVEVCAD